MVRVRSKTSGQKPSSVRIIGGSWRGTRVVRVQDSIRPTGDRVRETLFSWLTHRLPGGKVLDLFAGTGALGLEALSRGAEAAEFVEQDSATATAIEELLVKLKCEAAVVRKMDARRYLEGEPQQFDLVFLDPPFADRDLDILCKLLEDRQWLAPAALVYIEADRGQGLPSLPANWQIQKEKTAGDVVFALIERHT
jgi:16S rRNA (guanine966-N2)-methyltransferase